MDIQVAWATDAGLRRGNNEDAVLVWRQRAGADLLLVVADGIGGQAAGQRASRLTVETFATVLDEDGHKGSQPARLQNALMKANARVLQASHEELDVIGMGSTLAAAVIDHRQLGLVNVGDSSICLIRGHSIQLLSEDHSWPAELARQGLITQEEVHNHGMKHILARAIGKSESVEGYYCQMPMKRGDMLVLWTDGVEAAQVTAEEIGEWLGMEDLDAGVKRVLNYCRQRGAPDNVSLVAARLG